MNSISGSTSSQTQVHWIPKLGLFQPELIGLPDTFYKGWGTGPDWSRRTGKLRRMSSSPLGLWRLRRRADCSLCEAEQRRRVLVALEQNSLRCV